MRNSRLRPSIIIDSSVACAWHIPHEKHSFIDDILSKIALGELLAIAPKLWVFEVHNVLPKRVRKFDYPESVSNDALNALLESTIELKAYLPAIDRSKSAPFPLASSFELVDMDAVKVASLRVLELVRKYPQISFYDAVYLDLAKQENATLACLDDHLAKAAKAENVPLFIPIEVYDEWRANKAAWEKEFKPGNRNPG